jgi:hypothetical protein
MFSIKEMSTFSVEETIVGEILWMRIKNNNAQRNDFFRFKKSIFLPHEKTVDRFVMLATT